MAARQRQRQRAEAEARVTKSVAYLRARLGAMRNMRKEAICGAGGGRREEMGVGRNMSASSVIVVSAIGQVYACIFDLCFIICHLPWPLSCFQLK